MTVKNDRNQCCIFLGIRILMSDKIVVTCILCILGPQKGSGDKQTLSAFLENKGKRMLEAVSCVICGTKASGMSLIKFIF